MTPTLFEYNFKMETIVLGTAIKLITQTVITDQLIILRMIFCLV